MTSGSSQAKKAVAFPMRVVQPAEPSAQLTRSTIRMVVRGSSSRPPIASGTAMRYRPARRISLTSSGGMVRSASACDGEGLDAGNEGFGPLDHRHCVLLLLCFGYLTFRHPK